STQRLTVSQYEAPGTIARPFVFFWASLSSTRSARPDAVVLRLEDRARLALDGRGPPSLHSLNLAVLKLRRADDERGHSVARAPPPAGRPAAGGLPSAW